MTVTTESGHTERERRPRPMALFAALVAAIKNGHEGGFAANWNEDDAEPGFWIPYEDYINLRHALDRTIGDDVLGLTHSTEWSPL